MYNVTIDSLNALTLIKIKNGIYASCSLNCMNRQTAKFLYNFSFISFFLSFPLQALFFIAKSGFAHGRLKN